MASKSIGPCVRRVLSHRSKALEIKCYVRAFCLMVAVLLATSCAEQPTIIPPTSTSKPTVNLGTQQTKVKKPTATVTSSLTQTPSPIGTPIDISVSEVGISQSPMEVTFGVPIEELAPSIYLTYKTDETPGLGYLSIDMTQQGLLFSSSKKLSEMVFLDQPSKVQVIGTIDPRTREVIDLTARSNRRLEHLCSDNKVFPSPDGIWLGQICTSIGEKQDGEVIVELLSLEDEMKLMLDIPSFSGFRADDVIYWVSSDAFISSFGVNREPCLINISEHSMRCASIPERQSVIGISQEKWILVGDSGTNIKTIYLFDCLTSTDKCEIIHMLEDDFALQAEMHWSPDGTMLGVVSGAGIGSDTTTIGYYDTDNWELHILSEIPGDHFFVDWCPDSRCLVVMGNIPNQPGGHIVYLDGILQEIPGIRPQQVIEIH
jgi:hypothetical protein